MAKSNRKFDTSSESEVVQLDLGRRKRFHTKDLIEITPKTDNQSKALAAMFGQYDMVNLTGSSGAGKTFLALYAALHQVLDSSTPFERIILMRTAVATREQGFIKGSLEDKEAVYEAPYHGLIGDIMPKFNSGYEHLKALGYIEFCKTSYIRGSTWHDSIIVFDESENANAHEIYTVLTRLGENSKIFLAGDEKQTDLRKEKSGFGYLEKLSTLLPYESCQTIAFTTDDVVRSGFAKAVTIADNYIDR